MHTFPLRGSSFGLFLIFFIFACQKRQEKSSASPVPADIQAARNYFDNAISSSLQAPTTTNFRARLTKTIRWDLAQMTTVSGRTAVVAPVQFAGNTYVSSDLAPGAAFDLGSITRLLVFRDSNNAFHCGLLTYVPDSNAISTQSFNSGLLLYEDWRGNSLVTPHRFAKKTIALSGNGDKRTDVIQSIQVCNTIDGYNYSPDDPTGGVTTWSETSCNTYGLPATTTGPAIGPGNLSNFFLRPPIPLAVVITPPNNIIANILDYIKCFSNYGGTDHTYQVAVCVDQPLPGSREAWALTSTGVGGSTSGTNPVDAGHTFLVLSENFSGYSIVRNIGFYPQTDVMPWSTSAQGQLNNDNGHAYNISLTITVDNGQFFNILNYISQGNNSGYLYDLNSNNCTSFAIHALEAGNINLPATVGSWPDGGYGYDPGDLGEDIRNMPLSSNMTRNTTYNDHPNKYTCN